jgi:Domain of unknown function (DUF4129)
MRRFLLFLFTLALGLGVSIVRTQGQTTEPFAQSASKAECDAQEFVAELERVSNLLANKPSEKELAVLRDSLPKQWTVQTTEGTYSISTEFLDKELAAGAAGIAKEWADRRLGEVRNYSTRGPAWNGASRAELDKILAGSEFVGVRPPGPWELWRERVAAWIGRLLDKMFGGIERYPIGGQILFWTIIAACIGFIGLWLIRFLEGFDRMDTLPAGKIVFATKTWQEWVRMAREAAAQGNFREAVHSAYWAGITRLEDSGALPKDRSKTPREYLRLIANPATHELAQRPNYREPLTELTKRLERTWYANRGAGPDDFKETLRQLEVMGCPLE